MNSVLAFLTAFLVSVSFAETPATTTDLDYVFGPLEIVDIADEDDEEEEPFVYIEVLEPEREIHFGDEVTLVCMVYGLDDVEYEINWQYCTDIEIGDYHDLGCHDDVYVFTATYDNVGYYYRVVISYDTGGAT